MRLTDIDALSFDCYGTLIDWEAGIAAVLSPWARAHHLHLSVEELLERYAVVEARQEELTPRALYPDILDAAMRSLGTALGIDVTAEESERLATSVPDWPAFPDSPSALARLAANRSCRHSHNPGKVRHIRRSLVLRLRRNGKESRENSRLSDRAR